MNGINVLQKAIKILEAGPLPENYSEHGYYCPYCAIALSKSILDDEHNSGASFQECITQIVETGIIILDSDRPLEEAAISLNEIKEPFTKSKSIEAMITGIKMINIYYKYQL